MRQCKTVLLLLVGEDAGGSGGDGGAGGAGDACRNDILLLFH